MQDGDVMRCIQQREKLPQPEACPEEAYALMLDCWKLDVSRRASAAELLEKIGQVYSTYEPPRAWQSISGFQQASSAGSQTIDLSSATATANFASLQVSESSITLGKLLGEGEFGQVNLGSVTKSNGTVVEAAIKTIKDSSIIVVREQFISEAKLLAALKHPNIVSVVAVHIGSAESYLALELMAGGDLSGYLTDRGSHRFPLDELMGVLTQIADAMSYLERCRIVHRDLAARFLYSFCPVFSTKTS